LYQQSSTDQTVKPEEWSVTVKVGCWVEVSRVRLVTKTKMTLWGKYGSVKRRKDRGNLAEVRSS
jgi:hypothetical protein